MVFRLFGKFTSTSMEQLQSAAVSEDPSGQAQMLKILVGRFLLKSSERWSKLKD
jgi:hypothetical protein